MQPARRCKVLATPRFILYTSAMHSSPSLLTGVKRREFIRRTSLAAGALAFPFVSARNVLGANSKLNIAAIGAGGKGATLGRPATAALFLSLERG